MATPDNKFVKFLEEDGHFSNLILTFKVTLIALLISLGYAIIMYAYSDYLVKHFNDKITQNKVLFLFFVFLFTYGLMASALSIKDAIMFSKYRIDFINSCEE